MQRIVIILFLSINLSFCTKEEFFIKLEISEVGCLNPWGSSSDIGLIKAFLRTKDIHPIQVYRENVSPPGTYSCMSCGCPTGWATFIIVFSEDEKKALDLGFVKANR